MFLLISISLGLLIFWLFIYYKAASRLIQSFSKPKVSQQDIVADYLDRYYKPPSKSIPKTKEDIKFKEIKQKPSQQELDSPKKKTIHRKILSKDDIKKAMILKELLDNNPEDLFKR